MPRGGTASASKSVSSLPPTYVLKSSTSSLLHGYDTGVIAGALLYLVPALSLQSSPFTVGLIVTSCTLGAILGSIVTPSYLESKGRVPVLRVSSVMFFLSALLSGYSPTAAYLVLARFLAGIAMGAVSATVPLYVSETSPTAERGRYATVPQLMISSGILMSYFVDLAILLLVGGRWRVMLGMAASPAVIMMLACWRLKESPRWLAMKGRAEEAEDNLRALRKRDDVSVEMAEIKASVAEQKAKAMSSSSSSDSAPLSELLKDKVASRRLFTVVVLQAFQQLSGINAIVYFTPLILREAGVSALTARVVSDPNGASMLSTILAYAPKIPSLFLAGVLMDRMGRKSLLRSFVPMMGASLVTLACAFKLPQGNVVRAGMAVAGVMAYGVAFCLSLGPIPSILSSEVFPPRFRDAGMSTSIFFQWTFNAALTLVFPWVRGRVGTEACLWGFAAMCGACWWFTGAFVEETKGKSLEEIAG